MFDGKFGRFDTIRQRDRQTDKLTDTAQQQRSRRYGQWTSINLSITNSELREKKVFCN